MNIEVILSPSLYDGRQLKEHHTTVPVDILRATSAICAAFQSGASEIVPLVSLDDLPAYSNRGYLVAAERNGAKLHGASCGNSPTEYLSMNLHGQRLAYSTTNGTVSVMRAADSDSVAIGAFANISRLAAFLSGNPDGNLVILCSGWKGDPCIEDTLFAGALATRIASDGTPTTLVNDAAMMATDLWQAHSADLYDYCAKATHVKRLQSLGCDADIRWALQCDTCNVLPLLNSESKSLYTI